VTITNVEHGDDDDGVPIEELALAYERFTITFTGPDQGAARRQTTFTHP
jgi:hypothetical protein